MCVGGSLNNHCVIKEWFNDFPLACLFKYWGEDKIPAIFQGIYWYVNISSLEWKMLHFDSGFTKFVPIGHINNNPALVQMMPCLQTSTSDYLHQWWPCSLISMLPLHWHHNECEGVSNPRCLDCLFNLLFRCRIMKKSKAFMREIKRWPVDSPHKGPVTLPFHDVLMIIWCGTIVTIQSVWWLQMAWHPFGARTSATMMTVHIKSTPM